MWDVLSTDIYIDIWQGLVCSRAKITEESGEGRGLMGKGGGVPFLLLAQFVSRKE